MNSKSHRTASPRDVEVANIVNSNELDFSTRWTRMHFLPLFRTLPHSTAWNSIICLLVLDGILAVILDFDALWAKMFDGVYNLMYLVHVLAIMRAYVGRGQTHWDVWSIFGFVIDLASFSHYLVFFAPQVFVNKLACYYLRLHRPFCYLWQLNDYHMRCSVIATALKYSYMFIVVRITWAIVWRYTGQFEIQYHLKDPLRPLSVISSGVNSSADISSPESFFRALYLVNKMFMPIGPSVAPKNDVERVVCLLIMISGSIVVTGAAVASLSHVISIYMRPEESFRSRYRLIMKQMRESHIPPSLRARVKTFYSMYWHKQRAVTATRLLPTFPPTLAAMVYADIYFKATQKSQILRDLSDQFLTEVAKKMETIHYIPGDPIVVRAANKSAIVYIAYGDVEVVTAEDDSTAVLRMIRGTVLTPHAGCPAVGSGRAHVEVRAATFCTAHVLSSTDLWRTALKYGRNTGQRDVILGSFYQHLHKVKRHYSQRFHYRDVYKSSILHFKRNLMDLKESRDASGEKVLAKSDLKLEIAGCYIMRNRAVASLVDESDAICLRPTFPCILQPKSCLQTVWHSFITCLILAVCITHPYVLVFRREVPVWFRQYDYVVSVLFVVDMLVHLSTGAHVEDGVPMTLSQTAAQQARGRWLALDVLAVWPALELVGDGHFAGINKLLRLPKVFRMLKALEDECVYQSHVLRFISFSLLLLIACYLMSALQHGFMCYNFGYCYLANYTHPPYWADKAEINEFDDIVFCLYWAVSMITFTTHLEAWSGQNWNNVAFTTCMLELCIVLHVFVEAVYSATIMVTSAMLDNYEACIKDVTNFLVRNDVESTLRQRFIVYLQLDWYTDKAYSMTHKKESILHDLPPHVSHDILARQRIHYLLRIPFMNLLNREDLRNVATNASVFYTSPGEVLLNTGDITNEMYVVKQGSCEILCPKTKGVTGKLDAYNHFGVLECMLRFPAYYTVRAATHVQVFSISRKYLLNAIDIPKIKDAIELAKQLPEYQRLQVRHKPFTSYVPPVPAPNRERFRLPRKHEQDLAFLHPFYDLGVLSVLRYIFPRFTVRPDGRYLVHSERARAVCALLSAVLFPGYTYLVLQWPVLYLVTTLLDFAAYFDILQRMLVGYYNEKGLLVYHPLSTAAHYLKGPFFVDLLACLPLEFLESAWQEAYDDRYRIAPTKQYLMLNRLLQLYRTPGALLSLTGLIRGDILLVIRATPLFLALLNVLTCFVVFSSVDIFYKTQQYSWYIVPHADVGGSWINLFQNEVRFNMTENPFNLHLAVFFWVVYETTSTGYNTFKPTNSNVTIALINAMIIGTLIATYYAVRIISMRANVNRPLATFQQHMTDITVFMRREKLEQDLVQYIQDVQQYYSYNWNKMGGADYRSVLKLCKQITLRTDAILHIFGPTFTKCPILNQCDVSLLRIVGRAVRSFHFLEKTTIVGRDDIISDIYFVDEGTVTVTEEDTIVTLARGSMFGNLQCSGTLRCPVSFTSATSVHLLQINSGVFFKVIGDFPIACKLMEVYRPNNENYISGILEFENLNPKEVSKLTGIARNFKALNIRKTGVQLYLIVVCLVCIYTDVYNAGFQDNSLEMVVGLYVLDVAFCFKFLIQYISAQDESLDSVRWRYSKKDLYIDIISCVPIELFAFLASENRWMKFSALRLNRVLRITTVYKWLQRHQDRTAVSLSLSMVCAVTVWSSLLVHAAAALWYFLGIVEENAAPMSSWLFNDDGEPWCSDEYVCSLYFVLTTFTQNGVGDILPKQQSEMVFVSLLQLISTLMYIIFLGEFSNLIQYRSFRSFTYYSQCLELQAFLKNSRVSRTLARMVQKYSLHVWRESRGVQLPHLLLDAPPALRLRIMAAAYLHHLTRNDRFKDCETAFLRQLVGCFQFYTYNEDMYVVKEMEITDSMYFIHSGRVLETSESSSTVKVYDEGDCFGMINGFSYNIPYKFSYRTLTKSQVLTLNLKDWEDLLKHFPTSKNAIYNIINDDDLNDDSGNEYENNLQGNAKSDNKSSKNTSGSLNKLPENTKKESAWNEFREKMSNRSLEVVASTQEAGPSTITVTTSVPQEQEYSRSTNNLLPLEKAARESNLTNEGPVGQVHLTLKRSNENVKDIIKTIERNVDDKISSLNSLYKTEADKVKPALDETNDEQIAGTSKRDTSRDIIKPKTSFEHLDKQILTKYSKSVEDYIEELNSPRSQNPTKINMGVILIKNITKFLRRILHHEGHAKSTDSHELEAINKSINKEGNAPSGSSHKYTSPSEEKPTENMY